MKSRKSVSSIIWRTIKKKSFLSAGIVFAVAASVFSESFREGLLTVFGQKITHALRSSLMDKYTHLTADSLTGQEPGAVVSRFVGDVDVVEKLFTSGILCSMAIRLRKKSRGSATATTSAFSGMSLIRFA